MLNPTTGIASLTNFKRQTLQYLDWLYESGELVVITVKDRAKVIV